MAAVGSSISTSLAFESRVRAMATAWRWPPDILRDEIARPGFRFELLKQLRRTVDHRLLVEDADGPKALFDFAAEKYVLGGGQIVRQRQVLIHDFDTLGARLDRLVEVADFCPPRRFPLPRREISGHGLTMVDLPAPLSPIRPTTSPPSTWKADVGQSLDGPEILGNVANLKHRHSGSSPENLLVLTRLHARQLIRNAFNTIIFRPGSAREQPTACINR